MNPHRLDTIAVHAGEPHPRVDGAVVLPIFQSSTYEHGGETGYKDVRYLRLNNSPNHLALHKKLAALESAESALVTSSGMAAITVALLTVLRAGDHVLCQNTLYGGTHEFIVNRLPSFGIQFDFIDPHDPSSWASKKKPETRAMYLESISNPLMEVPCLREAVTFCQQNQMTSMIDNTFPSPVNFRPSELGFNLSIHSATKYLNGHSDLVAGAVIGDASLIEKVMKTLNLFGASLDTHAAFLLHRGLKTLALRVRHQNQSALAIAQFLKSHASVSRVNYPGLETSPSFARAKDYFSGFSGMLSFELNGGRSAADHLLKRISIPIVAPSLGGAESLITLPATTSHVGLSVEERHKIGVSDGLIRLSVGVEATEDLIEDLDQALSEC